MSCLKRGTVVSRSLQVVILLVSLVIYPCIGHAAPGDLDKQFGAGGGWTASAVIGYDDVEAYAIAIQPKDGKIVVAGSARTGGVSPSSDFVIVRYNRDGTLDTNFGKDGKVTTDFNGGDDKAFAVGVSGEKIVAAGTAFSGSNYEFALVRYNGDGTPDISFDKDGKVTTDFNGGDDKAFAVGVSGEKIVVAGTAFGGKDYEFALARYNDNGTLDTNFDKDGKVTTALSGGDDMAHALGIYDGKIVAAGSRSELKDSHFAVVQYQSDGSLDTSFGTGGKVITDIGSGNGFAFALGIQPGGKIVAAGYAPIGGNSGFALVRYNSDGSLDSGFGKGGADGDGIVTTAIGRISKAHAMAIQSDGKIVVAGPSSSDGKYDDFTLVRYNSDGTPDTKFGTSGNGVVITPISSNTDEPHALAIQSDGNIVVTGYTVVGIHKDIALARYMGGTAPAPTPAPAPAPTPTPVTGAVPGGETEAATAGEAEVVTGGVGVTAGESGAAIGGEAGTTAGEANASAAEGGGGCSLLPSLR